jgi:hypothetical protein
VSRRHLKVCFFLVILLLGSHYTLEILCNLSVAGCVSYPASEPASVVSRILLLLPYSGQGSGYICSPDRVFFPLYLLILFHLACSPCFIAPYRLFARLRGSAYSPPHSRGRLAYLPFSEKEQPEVSRLSASVAWPWPLAWSLTTCLTRPSSTTFGFKHSSSFC